MTRPIIALYVVTILTAAPEAHTDVVMPECKGMWRLLSLPGNTEETIPFTVQAPKRGEVRVVDQESHQVATLRDGQARSWECLSLINKP